MGLERIGFSSKLTPNQANNYFEEMDERSSEVNPYNDDFGEPSDLLIGEAMEVNGIRRLYNEDELRLHYQEEEMSRDRAYHQFHQLDTSSSLLAHSNNTSYQSSNNSANFSEEAWSCLFNYTTSSADTLDFQKHQQLRMENLGSSPEFNTSFPLFSGQNESLGSHGSYLICNRSWDGILCWPETPAGEEAILPCFSQLNGVRYDTSRK